MVRIALQAYLGRLGSAHAIGGLRAAYLFFIDYAAGAARLDAAELDARLAGAPPPGAAAPAELAPRHQFSRPSPVKPARAARRAAGGRPLRTSGQS
jgi:hypothetical protein